MSANLCVAFFGVRYEVHVDDVEALENRSDGRIVAARGAGLNSYWGNFGADRERYLLFVGTELGRLGPENKSEVAVGPVDFLNIVESTTAALRKADLNGEPALHIQWQDDI